MRRLRLGGFSRAGKTGFWLGGDGKKPLLPQIVGTNDLLVKGRKEGSYEVAEAFDDSLFHPSGGKFVAETSEVVGEERERRRSLNQRISIWKGNKNETIGEDQYSYFQWLDHFLYFYFH